MVLSEDEKELYDKLREKYDCPRKPYPIHLRGERLDGSISCLIHNNEIKLQLHDATTKTKKRGRRKDNTTLWNFM